MGFLLAENAGGRGGGGRARAQGARAQGPGAQGPSAQGPGAQGPGARWHPLNQFHVAQAPDGTTTTTPYNTKLSRAGAGGEAPCLLFSIINRSQGEVDKSIISSDFLQNRRDPMQDPTGSAVARYHELCVFAWVWCILCDGILAGSDGIRAGRGGKICYFL